MLQPYGALAKGAAVLIALPAWALGIVTGAIAGLSQGIKNIIGG
jgi:hypothetical protein